MVILIDTNILLDFFLHREPGYLTCKAVIDYCVENHGKGYVAFHSIPTIFYVLRKYADLDKRKSILKDICSILTVTGVNHEDVVEAIDREDFYDFEDCLQMYCAKGIDADYIVTNNIKDYSGSDIPAITSGQMVEIIAEQREEEDTEE